MDRGSAPSVPLQALLLIVTYQTANTSKRGADIGVGQVAVASNSVRSHDEKDVMNDQLPDKIIYDAQTTSGGSGGPLFNDQGQVIGINFAMVCDFGGSNLAVPVRLGESLLKP